MQVRTTAAGLALSLLAAAGPLDAQEAHVLRYGFQSGELYHYRIEMSWSFTGGETRNHETIRGVETLVVVGREADTITVLPLPFGFHLTEYLVHGEDLTALASRTQGRGDPFFGTPLRYQTPSDGAPNPLLGAVVARLSTTGVAPPEAMVPRFWGVLPPLGERLQNFFPMTAYPWTRLPADLVNVGQSWDFPLPGTPDTFRYEYEGRETGEIACDRVRGSIDISGETAAQWGSPEGAAVRSTVCLATEGGFPVTEEVQAKRHMGTVGVSEEWIRAVLIGRGRFEEETLEVLREAARPAPEVRPAESNPLGALVDHPAPDLEVQEPDGSSRHLSSFLGRVVVMHFWVPWLSLSAQTLASLRDLRPELDSSDVEVLPIVIEDDAMRRLGVASLVLEQIDPSASLVRPAEVGNLAAFHANEVVPVTVIVDREGIVRKAVAGPLGTEALRTSIREVAGR